MQFTSTNPYCCCETDYKHSLDVVYQHQLSLLLENGL